MCKDQCQCKILHSYSTFIGLNADIRYITRYLHSLCHILLQFATANMLFIHIHKSIFILYFKPYSSWGIPEHTVLSSILQQLCIKRL